MKKITLNLGVISSILFIIGVLFKWQHWPGASIALCLSIVIFALAYSPLLLIDRNKVAKDSNQRMTNIVAAVAMIIISLTFLFKAMHWPGAGIGIIIGNFTLIILVPILFYRASKESDTTKKINSWNEAIIMVFLTGFSLFLWLVFSQNI